MDYVSTRGKTEPMSFKDAMLTGLAPDSGLLIPAFVPDIRSRLDHWRTLNYVDLAFEVLATNPSLTLKSPQWSPSGIFT